MMTPNPETIRKRVDVALREHIDLAIASHVAASAKPGQVKVLGVRTPSVRQIANAFFRELKFHGIKNLDSIIPYCEYLLAQRISEYRTIAFQWNFKCKVQFHPKHFDLFERWLKIYVTSWGSCDDFSTHTLGYFLLQFPEFIPQVKTWTHSPNQWVRRAAAVSFIYALRRGKYLSHAFEIADSVLQDSEMYVLKGYGWMLKEATKHFQEEVFQYVLTHKDTMPRVSLRYAIEKMPKPLKQEAMKK
jgi:3-methyladenine DNA glycosylase AlkD